jgi:hypothetical protein
VQLGKQHNTKVHYKNDHMDYYLGLVALADVRSDVSDRAGCVSLVTLQANNWAKSYFGQQFNDQARRIRPDGLRTDSGHGIASWIEAWVRRGKVVNAAVRRFIDVKTGGEALDYGLLPENGKLTFLENRAAVSKKKKATTKFSFSTIQCAASLPDVDCIQLLGWFAQGSFDSAVFQTVRFQNICTVRPGPLSEHRFAARSAEFVSASRGRRTPCLTP